MRQTTPRKLYVAGAPQRVRQLDKHDITLKDMLSRDIVARSLRISLVVGTILVLINHIDALLSGNITFGLLVKIVLTYMVPYSVSSYSSYCALRDASRAD